MPGVVAGMEAALTRYGSFSLTEAIAPAEKLAREGIRVPLSMQGAARSEAERIANFPATAAIFLPGGQPIARIGPVVGADRPPDRRGAEDRLGRPPVQLAGTDASGRRLAVSDSRSDRAALAERGR